jgi:multidrug efflux pump subunit AcrB
VGSKVTAGFGGGSGTHLGTVVVQFVDFEDREIDAFETLDLIRGTAGVNVAGADVALEEPEMGPPTGLPINIEITGDDPVLLKQLGDDAVSRLENSALFAKLDGLESDMSEGRPELVIQVDREKAALYGLTTQDIGITIRNAINGTEASKYRDGKDEYDITVRLAEEYRGDLSSLGVMSDVRSGYNAVAVRGEVEQELAEFAASLPTGYQMRFTGQQQEQEESEEFLTGAFVLALFLIGFILVTQFDSVTKPLIILSSVLLSTIGVFIGLMVFRMPFGIIMTGSCVAGTSWSDVRRSCRVGRPVSGR